MYWAGLHWRRSWPGTGTLGFTLRHDGPIRTPSLNCYNQCQVPNKPSAPTHEDGTRKKDKKPPLTTGIQRIAIRIPQTRRRTQLDGILHVLHLLHDAVAVIQRLGQVHVRQEAHDGAVHACDQRHVVRTGFAADDPRATGLREAGGQQPEGGADHDDFGRAPRHQGDESPAGGLAEAFGVEVGLGAVAFFQAGEARRCGRRSQPPGAVGGDGDGVAGGYLLEEVHDGCLVGGGFEEGGVAVGGRGAFFDVLDHFLEVLPDQGEEGLELGRFGVRLAGAAEEDLVVAAGCCVVGSVVLEEEAGGGGIRGQEGKGGVGVARADIFLGKDNLPDD